MTLTCYPQTKSKHSGISIIRFNTLTAMSPEFASHHFLHKLIVSDYIYFQLEATLQLENSRVRITIFPNEKAFLIKDERVSGMMYSIFPMEKAAV